MSVTELPLNHQMLVLARESRGYSQKELADKINITPAYLSYAEQANRNLGEDVLQKISKELKYPISFFYQPGESYIPLSLRYRKREHVSAKVLVPLEAKMNIYRLNLETLSSRMNFPTPSIPGIETRKDSNFEEVAKAARKSLRIPKGPVNDLTKLLEQHGAVVISFDFGTERVDSRTVISSKGIPIIFINKLHNADRQRFSLAHELGHLVMHSKDTPFTRDISHEANMFAAGFLMPAAEIKKDFEKGVSLSLLAELKPKWKVSMQALLFRASDLELITDNQKRYLIQQFNQSGIRRREPVELDFPREQPTLLRNLITKYKDAQKLSLKGLADIFNLSPEDFTSSYS